MTTLLTVAAWAKAEGISRVSAYAAVKRCAIPVQDGKVDPVVASALYRARTRARVKAKAVAAAPAEKMQDDHISYDEARRRTEVARCLILEADARRLSGETLSVAWVVSEWTRALGVLRSRLLSLPSKCAPMVGGAGTPEAFRILEAEVLAALTELSSDGPGGAFSK